jgi:hypothetical protein
MITSEMEDGLKLDWTDTKVSSVNSGTHRDGYQVMFCSLAESGTNDLASCATR